MVDHTYPLPTQIIDGEGILHFSALEGFLHEVRLPKCGDAYVVVSIMGPQSGGKSTLLNHCFGTGFTEMDCLQGRSQTTRGIWIAEAAGIDPLTLVLDLEGSDGRERGEDDTAFEKQIALFALAVSDILIINMWCHDVGREHAASKPLLRTVFQVMMKLFGPKKKTLMFVIRDKEPTPLEKLESTIREDVQKIWESVTKPQAQQQTPLANFFNVQVVALSSFRFEREQFNAQVESLRQQFFHSTAAGGLADRETRDVIGASGFSLSVQKVWEVIKENKDLDIPAHRVIVAKLRCEQLSDEMFCSFTKNEDWLRLEEASQGGPMPDFGRKLSSMIQACISGYEEEAKYFDEGVRISTQKQLGEKLLRLVQPAFLSVMEHLRFTTLDKFKKDFNLTLSQGSGFQSAVRSFRQHYLAVFDEACTGAVIEQAMWNTTSVKEDLRRDMDSYIVFLRSDLMSHFSRSHEEKLNEALAGPVAALLDEANDNTWSSIRNLHQRETQRAISDLSLALSGFEIDEQEKEEKLAKLGDHAKGVVEAKAREGAGRVLILMKDRFSRLFFLDSNSMPRSLKGKENIMAITLAARSSSLKQLAVMAAVRLDDEADDVEGILSMALLVDHDTTGSANSASLASNTWEHIPPSRTMLSPIRCASLWRQFILETECIVAQAISAQEPNEVNRDWIPLTIQASSSAAGTLIQGLLLGASMLRRFG